MWKDENMERDGCAGSRDEFPYLHNETKITLCKASSQYQAGAEPLDPSEKRVCVKSKIIDG